MQTPVLEAPLADGGRSPLSDHVELTKPRITLMVVVTTTVGLLMAMRVDPDVGHRLSGSSFLIGLDLAAALLGTTLLAAGASALNMWSERQSDALMRRTSSRPLPSGRLLPDRALETGVSLSGAGAAALFFGVNGLTALLGVITLFLYVLVYTPLKRRTHWNTHVGAVPGALPILMGYAAWADRLDLLAWTLFALLFLWQLPHFFVIDWRYREDYRTGGYRMLSGVDPSGRRSALETVVFTAALVAVSFSPPLLGLTTWLHPTVAGLFGAAFLHASIRFAASRSEADARRAMIVSVLYLPAVLGALVLDALLLGSGWLG